MWAVTVTPGTGEGCFRGVVATMYLCCRSRVEVRPAEHTVMVVQLVLRRRCGRWRMPCKVTSYSLVLSAVR